MAGLVACPSFAQPDSVCKSDAIRQAKERGGGEPHLQRIRMLRSYWSADWHKAEHWPEPAETLVVLMVARSAFWRVCYPNYKRRWRVFTDIERLHCWGSSQHNNLLPVATFFCLLPTTKGACQKWERKNKEQPVKRAACKKSRNLISEWFGENSEYF